MALSSHVHAGCGSRCFAVARANATLSKWVCDTTILPESNPANLSKTSGKVGAPATASSSMPCIATFMESKKSSGSTNEVNRSAG